MVPRLPYLRQSAPFAAAIAAAAAVLIVPAIAVAAPCNFGPSAGSGGVRDFAGEDWIVDSNSVVLCSGQYLNVGTFTLPAGRTLRIGDGAQVLISANTLRLRGKIDGVGVGPSGGSACRFNARAPGSSGSGSGGGQGGRSASSGSVGGGGGGGGGHGAAGGGGGRGVGNSQGGTAGSSYGSIDVLEELTSGSGGGGGACGSSYTDEGGAGGRGGASVFLAGAVVDFIGGSVDMGGGNGAHAPLAGGGGGGGGSGGGITVLAFERLLPNGTLLSRGGDGGNGSSPRVTERNGGGGGAGAGGRVKVFLAGDCGADIASAVSVAGGSPGDGPGSAAAGQPGGAGTFRCENVQAPPAIVSFTATPNPQDEGKTVTLSVDASDPNHHLLKYEFDCGNGVFSAPIVANTFECAYSDNRPGDAPYTTRVRATDWNRVPFTDGFGAVTDPPGSVAFGGAVIASTGVVVRNEPPSVTLHLPAEPKAGMPLTFSIDVADPSSVDQQAGFDVKWVIGTTPPFTDTTPDNFSVTHTFGSSGEFPVDVWVTDKDGGVTHVSATLVIPNLPPEVTLGVFPPEVVQGKSAVFTASAVDASEVDSAAGYEFEFDFGDGTVVVVHGGANGAPVEVVHVYEESGPFTVSVTARDISGGVSAPDSRALVVLPGALPPSVSITATPTSLDEGSQTMFAVSFAARAPGSTVVRVDMNFGNGVVQTVTSPASPRSFPHTYVDSGRFTARALVVDSAGAENVATVEIVVANVAPTALLPAGVRGPEGTPLQVFGNATDPSSTDVQAGLTYSWDWGDGSEPTVGVELRQPFHTWENSGEYTITLTVTDKDGAVSAPVTAKAIIDNVAPLVDLVAPSEAGEGETVAFSATVTDPSPADTAAGFTFVWDFGDLSLKRSGKDLAAVEHAYEQDGEYELRLEVSDESGGTTVRTATITVRNVAPLIDMGPPLSVARHEEVTLTALVRDPGVHDTHAYAWSFGDGGTSTEVSPKHAWSASGVFTVSLTVTDDGGASATGTLPVTVRNELPVASSVVVKPDSPMPSHDLTVTWTYSDPENDPEQGTVVEWFASGVRMASLRNATTVPASRTLRGQVWYAEVTPHDGLSAGETVRSNSVTIGNTPPQATNVRLEPAPPRRGDALTLRYDFVDADGDVEGTSSIRWRRNEAPVDALDDARSVPGPLRRGEVWRASVIPHDGQRYGTQVDALPVEVANTPPAVAPLPPLAVASTGSVTQVGWNIEASDADDDPLQYRCTSEGRVLGTNASVNVSLPDGAYLITCTVTDGIDPVVQEFQLVIGDHGPVVHAGPDLEVDPGRISLVATAKDPAGRPLTFEWRVVSTVHPVELSSHRSAETSFFARVEGAYELEVTVSNGERTASDTVVVTVRNLPPTADAGPSPRTGTEGVELALDGNGSTDPNGDLLSFQWRRVSGPPVEFLEPVASSDMRVVPHGPGELVLRLTVTDGHHEDSTEVSIRVAPAGSGATPPVAVAGNDVVALIGETVVLDGRGSFDVDGDVLVYQWSQVSGPSAQLADADAAVARFTAHQPGLLEFRLRVSDGLYDATDNVLVRVLDSGSNRRPIARLASELVEVRIGDEVELDGSASSDPNGDSLTFQWRHVSGPWVNLTDAQRPVARLVAVTEGTSVVELRVNDGMIDSHPVFAEIVASVTGPDEQPVAAVEAPSIAFVGERVVLDGTASHDPGGRELTFDWVVVKGSVDLETPGGPTPTFVPQRNGAYAFRLVVSNGVRDSAPVDVEIVVENLPALSGGCGCDGSGSSVWALLGLALLALRRRARG